MNVYQSIRQKTKIEKGWSGDQKYFVQTSDEQKYLLRISPIEQYERKKREFFRMSQVAQLEIPMCRPIEFGCCDEGVYSIQSWIDGYDAENIIGSYSKEQQYRYGQDAGRILSKIHTLPAPDDAMDWEQRFNAKIDRKIAMYKECAFKYENDAPFLNYIADHRHLLADRPQCYQHGDYHIGNMMIDKNGVLQIIDFDRDDYGDPWEEFNRIVWSAQDTPLFASGMIDGYFNDQVPIAFWKLLALYICSNTLGSLPWAIPFGQEEIQIMQRQAGQILRWYDHMCHVIPSWYVHHE